MKQNDAPNVNVTAETKATVTELATEWVVTNCRPFKIIEDSGLEKLLSYFINIGAEYGANVDTKSALPHRTTLARNVGGTYMDCFAAVKAEIAAIKDKGFSITTDLWSDNFLRQSYLCVTIQFVKDGTLFNRLLAIKSMEDERCTTKFFP